MAIDRDRDKIEGKSASLIRVRALCRGAGCVTRVLPFECDSKHEPFDGD